VYNLGGRASIFEKVPADELKSLVADVITNGIREEISDVKQYLKGLGARYDEEKLERLKKSRIDSIRQSQNDVIYEANQEFTPEKDSSNKESHIKSKLEQSMIHDSGFKDDKYNSENKSGVKIEDNESPELRKQANNLHSANVKIENTDSGRAAIIVSGGPQSPEALEEQRKEGKGLGHHESAPEVALPNLSQESPDLKTTQRMASSKSGGADPISQPKEFQLTTLEPIEIQATDNRLHHSKTSEKSAQTSKEAIPAQSSPPASPPEHTPPRPTTEVTTQTLPISPPPISIDPREKENIQGLLLKVDELLQRVDKERIEGEKRMDLAVVNLGMYFPVPKPDYRTVLSTDRVNSIQYVPDKKPQNIEEPTKNPFEQASSSYTPFRLTQPAESKQVNPSATNYSTHHNHDFAQPAPLPFSPHPPPHPSNSLHTSQLNGSASAPALPPSHPTPDAPHPTLTPVSTLANLHPQVNAHSQVEQCRGHLCCLSREQIVEMLAGRVAESGARSKKSERVRAEEWNECLHALKCIVNQSLESQSLFIVLSSLVISRDYIFAKQKAELRNMLSEAHNTILLVNNRTESFVNKFSPTKLEEGKQEEDLFLDLKDYKGFLNEVKQLLMMSKGVQETILNKIKLRDMQLKPGK
jgi:hypothetical protein